MGFYAVLICIIVFLIQRISFYKNLSEKDMFTGCYNRDWAIQRKNSKLVRMMKRTKRTGAKFGALFIDMDNFKQVNDTKGHLVGDEIIKETVAAIKSCLGDKDIVVRYGGDELLVVQDFVADNSLTLLAESIRLKVEFNTQRTVSIGGVVFNNGMDVNVGELVGAADAEVYNAKEKGKNNVCIKLY